MTRIDRPYRVLTSKHGAARSDVRPGRVASAATPAAPVERRHRVAVEGDVVTERAARVADGLATQLHAVVVDHLLVGEHRVEDPHDSHVEVVVAVVGHRHRLGVALGLVVHAARADRVDVAPVRLRLRVDQRVAVHLRRRGEEEAGPLGVGQPEAVVGAEAADLEDLDRDALEVDRRRRAGEVHHRVDVSGHPHVRADVVLVEREPTPPEQLLDVGDRPGDQVVDRHDVVAPIEQRPTQVRSEKSRSARDDDTRHSAIVDGGCLSRRVRSAVQCAHGTVNGGPRRRTRDRRT